VHSPQQPVRRSTRYPLQLPVTVRAAGREMHTQSENISVHGVLLSSNFRIPEGSAVELAVAMTIMPDAGIVLTGRGKVLRVKPRISGDFAIAIECKRPFGLARRVRTPPSLTWHTET